MSYVNITFGSGTLRGPTFVLENDIKIIRHYFNNYLAKWHVATVKTGGIAIEVGKHQTYEVDFNSPQAKVALEIALKKIEETLAQAQEE